MPCRSWSLRKHLPWIFIISTCISLQPPKTGINILHTRSWGLERKVTYWKAHLAHTRIGKSNPRQSKDPYLPCIKWSICPLEKLQSPHQHDQSWSRKGRGCINIILLQSRLVLYLFAWLRIMLLASSQKYSKDSPFNLIIQVKINKSKHCFIAVCPFIVELYVLGVEFFVSVTNKFHQ